MLTDKLEDIVVLVSQKDAEIASLKVALLKPNAKRPGVVEILHVENSDLEEIFTNLDAKGEDLIQKLLNSYAAESEHMTLLLRQLSDPLS